MPPPNIDDNSKYDALHVKAPDDSEYVMNGVYRDMAVATFKRTVAIRGKIRSWEGIELYYMGVEMQNSMASMVVFSPLLTQGTAGRTLDSYDLEDVSSIVPFIFD